MANPRFVYQTEKLSNARRCLMGPHGGGEERAFLLAFESCGRAFDDLDEATITDQDALDWIRTIKKTMDTTDVEDPTNEGFWLHRIRSLTFDQKADFARCVDELASWFDRKFWNPNG